VAFVRRVRARRREEKDDGQDDDDDGQDDDDEEGNIGKMVRTASASGLTPFSMRETQ